MKKIVLILPLIALLSVSCNNNNDADNRRIQELEDKIAQLEKDKSENNKSEVSKVNTETQSEENDLTYSDFVGTYQFTDLDGNNYEIKVNDDKTFTLKHNTNETEYGSVGVYIYNGYIKLLFSDDAKFNVKIKFPEGLNEGILSPTIREGYVYDNESSARAKNPKWRLPIKKVK